MVGKLTLEQKLLIEGQCFAPDSFFLVSQDINNNWFISQEQINQCTKPDFQWIKELPLIEYEPKPNSLLF